MVEEAGLRALKAGERDRLRWSETLDKFGVEARPTGVDQFTPVAGRETEPDVLPARRLRWAMSRLIVVLMFAHDSTASGVVPLGDALRGLASLLGDATCRDKALFNSLVKVLEVVGGASNDIILRAGLVGLLKLSSCLWII